MKTRNLLLASSLLALTAGSAQAAIVVSNLGNSPQSAWLVGSGSTLVDSAVANQFTTGAGPGWHLDSVTLKVGLGSSSPSGSLNAYLAADNAGLPGALLVSLLGSDPGSAQEDITYTPQTTFDLATNTSYWVVTSALVNDNYDWWYTFDTAQTGAVGWSIGNTSYAQYGPNGWTALDFGPTSTPTPTLFEVNATETVPTPASALLMLPGLLGLAGLRRHKAAERDSGSAIPGTH